MLWALLTVAVVLQLYANRWIVLSYPERPSWMSPRGQARFFIARLLLICGTLAMIWRQYNLLTAAVALVAYYLFERISIGVYYRRELRRLTRHYAELSTREAMKQDKATDAGTTNRMALEIATSIIKNRMKGQGSDYD